MSNRHSLAFVTAFLRARIEDLITAADLADFAAIAGHPSDRDTAGVYVQLFRVERNASLVNADVPTRRAHDGSLMHRPRLALELDYLFTFVGEPETFDAERLAALVMTDFHERPILSRERLQRFRDELEGDSVVRSSDLMDQIEKVRITHIPMTLEEMSRLWGLLNQSFYAPSVAYRVSAILLDSDASAITPRPVLEPRVRAVPAPPPRLRSALDAATEQPAVTAGGVLVLRGSDLRGETTWVRIGESLTRVPDEEARPDRLEVVLDGIPAGIHGVQVVHRVDMSAGAGEELRDSAQSNVLAFALLPAVTAPSLTGGALRVTVAPTPSADQRVELVLDGAAGHVASSAWSVSGAELVFTLPAALASGEWLVRVRVDGAISLPAPDMSAPVVTVA